MNYKSNSLTVSSPTKLLKQKIVEADDTSIVTLQNEKEELLLTTCYPSGYIGNAPQRYILYAEKI